jgi:hypothetical protein
VHSDGSKDVILANPYLYKATTGWYVAVISVKLNAEA